jgi:hypothetical protein
MRASAITLLIATGLWATACGSGESPSNAGPAQPLENGAYQKPASSYEDPPATGTPTDYQKPPSTYQPPGSSSGSGSTAGGSVCDIICELAAGGACKEGDIASLPPGDCVAACNQQLGGFPCPHQFADVVGCFVDQGLTCGDLESLGEGNPNDLPADVRNACTVPIQAFAACVEAQSPGAGGDGDCTLSSQCSGCQDDCAFCRCNNLGDDGPCTACRNNRNN